MDHTVFPFPVLADFGDLQNDVGEGQEEKEDANDDIMDDNDADTDDQGVARAHKTPGDLKYGEHIPIGSPKRDHEGLLYEQAIRQEASDAIFKKASRFCGAFILFAPCGWFVLYILQVFFYFCERGKFFRAYQ